jgi:catecholate siderophore receptor
LHRIQFETMDLQLNVQNPFNKAYYSSAYPIYATWAPGRSAMVTLNFYQ